MRPYRLRKYITGAGVLLAGASLLSVPAHADDSGPSRAPVPQSRPAPSPRSGGSAAPGWRSGSSPAPGWRSGGTLPSPFTRPGPFGASPSRPATNNAPPFPGRSDGPTAPPRYGGGTPSLPLTPRGDAPAPFRRGTTDAPYTPRGNRPGRSGPGESSPSTADSGPGWRGGGSRNPSGGGNNPSRVWTPRGNDAPGRDRPTQGGTTDAPGRFGGNRNSGGADSGPSFSWRPPSRSPGASGRAPNRTSPHPSFRPTGPNERPNNPNERPNNPNAYGTPSWRIDPGRFTYINPRPNVRPPRVDSGRWTGTGGLTWGGRNFHRVSVGYVDPWCVYQVPVFSGVRFYYPFYYVGPVQVGFYYSPFWSYGSLFPTYIYPERVIVVERRTYIRDVVRDDSFYDPYSAQTTTLRDTMEDIRSAWLDGDGGLLLRHINDAFPVRILQKGDYKYSLEPDDYRDITKDALNRVDTISFEWTNVDRTQDDVVLLEARHTFRDDDGDKHTIRLSYTVEKARGSWWITQTDVAPW